MKKLDRGFFYKNYLAKQGIFSYHSSVVLAHPLFRWMMLRGERTSCQVWFFLFLFHTPIYTKEYGYTIAKTACRKKQHARIELLFIIKILIRCKPAVIDKFNSPANILLRELRVEGDAGSMTYMQAAVHAACIPYQTEREYAAFLLAIPILRSSQQHTQ